jgi:hypothetical protein
MEVDEAVDFFASMPNFAHPLQLLKDVGLGYRRRDAMAGLIECSIMPLDASHWAARGPTS